jgi:phosphoglycerate dehydrogenase-like enzyme
MKIGGKSMILIQHMQAEKRHQNRVEKAANGRHLVKAAKHLSDVHDLSQIEILFTYGKEIKLETFEEMTNLKWIHLSSTGFDHLPKDYIQDRVITVTTSKGAHAEPIAEYAFSTMLYFSRKIDRFLELQNNKKWGRLDFPTELAGSTLVILGMGYIGKEIAKKAQAFDMHTIGVNRSGMPSEFFNETNRIDQLDEILPKADYLILTLPLTSQTYHLIGKKQLNLLKHTSVVINIGRGELMDEAKAIEVLQSNRIRGMAMDVFHQEPLPQDSILWDLDSLLITPHMAAMTDRFLDRSIDRFIKNYQHYINGEKMVDVADFSKEY